MKKEIIIHVGAPKAASTYLQEFVFPFLKNVYYMLPFSVRFKNNEKEKKRWQGLMIS